MSRLGIDPSVSGLSNVGGRLTNDDRIGIQTGAGNGHLAVVADGVSKGGCGDMAAEIAVNTLLAAHAEGPIAAATGEQWVRQAIGKADAGVRQKEAEVAYHMCTTIVVALCLDQYLHVGWVGDSRAYLLRKGDLVPLTRDHSYVELHHLTAQQAHALHVSGIITHAVGGHCQIGYVLAELEPGDVVLLSTDGLHKTLSAADITHILGTAGDASQTAKSLIDAALSLQVHDNVSAVVIKF